MKVLNYIAAGCVAASLLLIAFFLGRVTGRKTPVEPLKRDTVIVTRVDTITREKPVFYASTTVDTLRIVVRDTIRQKDTLYIDLPREQRAYRDTLYEAWVSGVQPALDSIRIYPPAQYITVTEQIPVKEHARWGIGVNAGYGASLKDGGVILSPYIGIGISYNLLSF